jgi:hypothetical protein
MIDKRTLLPGLAILGGLVLSLPAYAQFSSPMHDVDNGARQPVNFGGNVSINDGSNQGANTTAVTIPAGKRLVIETVSFNGQVNSGEIGYLNIHVTAGAGTAGGATSATHVIPMIKLTTGFPSGDYIGGIGAFRMYADAGSTVTISYNRGASLSGAESITVFITGHYVNLP